MNLLISLYPTILSSHVVNIESKLTQENKPYITTTVLGYILDLDTEIYIRVVLGYILDLDTEIYIRVVRGDVRRDCMVTHCRLEHKAKSLPGQRRVTSQT